MPLSAALNDPKIALNGTPVYYGSSGSCIAMSCGYGHLHFYGFSNLKQSIDSIIYTLRGLR